MRWLIFTIMATLLFGIYSIFGERAAKVHGEKISFMLDTAVMIILSIFCLFYVRADIGRVTKLSFTYAVVMGLTSSLAFLMMLYALKIAPTDKMPIIMVIIGYSTVITAIIAHFLDIKLDPHKWFGVFVATFGVTLVNLEKIQIQKILSLFGLSNIYK